MNNVDQQRISTIAINITNGLMNVMTASIMQPETKEETEQMLGLCKEATKCFGKAINLFENKTNILTPNPNTFISKLNTK